MRQQQPGGEQQPLPASGLLAFCTTRLGDPRARRYSPATPNSPETNVSSTPGRPRADAANAPRRPGQWPAACQRTDPGDAAWMRHEAERARHEIVLGSIAAELAEQPSPRAIRAAGRRWCREITQLAEDLATTQREAA